MEADIWIAQHRRAIWTKCKAPKEPTRQTVYGRGNWIERDSTAMQ